MRRYVVALCLSLALGASAPRLARAESIPLKSENGTFVVPVLINGKITLDFTVDSGAAEVSIPLDVFLTLRRTDSISEGDLLLPGTFVTADGSVRQQERFRIRSLKVGSLELRNVAATVTPARGDLLLGQSFLSRLRTWSFDNQRHELQIDVSASAPTYASDVSANRYVAPTNYGSPNSYGSSSGYGTSSWTTPAGPRADPNDPVTQAARRRCLAVAGPSDEYLCDNLTVDQVARSTGVAPTGPRADVKADPKDLPAEAARRRCLAVAGPSDEHLCDNLTPDEVAKSEAIARGQR